MKVVKVVPESEVLCNVGRCNRCGSMQRLDRCKQLTSARLDLITGTDIKTVVAFSEVLDEIGQGNATVEKLLVSEEFNAIVYEKDVISRE